MNNTTVSPYINFQGRAHEAFEFYKNALGGEVTLLTENQQGPPSPAGPNDHVMHGTLKSDSITIMGADGLPEYPPTHGDNMALVLSGSNREKLSFAFDELSAGGNIKQALKTESWGDSFGYFEDKFGINWMVNITSEQNQ